MSWDLIAIGGGGAIGALARHGATHLCNEWFGTDFPYGTLLVNILGSLLMGLVFVLLMERIVLAPVWRSVLMVGFLGAFTTFSTFSLQTLALLETGRVLAAIGYVVTSVAICLVATTLGLFVARLIP